MNCTHQSRSEEYEDYEEDYEDDEDYDDYMDIRENFHPNPRTCKIISKLPSTIENQVVDDFCAGHGTEEEAMYFHNTFSDAALELLCQEGTCTECQMNRCPTCSEKPCQTCPTCPTAPTIQPMARTLKTCGTDNKSRLVCLPISDGASNLKNADAKSQTGPKGWTGPPR